MTAPARPVVSALPRSTPPAPGFRPSAELVARIDAVCARTGMTRAAFYEKAITGLVETCEAATTFRRTLETLPDPAWRARPANAAPLQVATLVAPTNGAESLPMIPDLVERRE